MIEVFYYKYVEEQKDFVYGRSDKAPEGFGDMGVVLEGNKLLYPLSRGIRIYAYTFEDVKEQIKLYRERYLSDTLIEVSCSSTDILGTVNETLHLMVGDYILEYEISECKSEWNRKNNTSYQRAKYYLNKIYNHNNGTTLMLMCIGGIGDNGLDKDIIDKIISESTEIEID